MATDCAAVMPLCGGPSSTMIDARVLACLSGVRDKLDMQDSKQKACAQHIDKDQISTKVRGWGTRGVRTYRHHY